MGKIAPFGFLNSAAPPPPPPIQYIYVASGNEATNTRTARTDRLNIANNTVSAFTLYRRAGYFTCLNSATHGFFSTWNSFSSNFPSNPSNSAYSAIIFASQTYVAQGFVTISDSTGIGSVNTTSWGMVWQRRQSNTTLIGGMFNYTSNTLVGAQAGPWDTNLQKAGRLPYTSTSTNTKKAYTGCATTGVGRFRLDISNGNVSFISGGFSVHTEAIQNSTAINNPSQGFRHYAGGKGGFFASYVTFSSNSEIAGGITPINGAAYHQTGYTATNGYLFRSDTNSGREVHISNKSVGATFGSIGALCAYNYNGYSVMQDTGEQ